MYLSLIMFFIAGYVAGITNLFALAVWYCRDGVQITFKGESNGEANTSI